MNKIYCFLILSSITCLGDLNECVKSEVSLAANTSQSATVSTPTDKLTAALSEGYPGKKPKYWEWESKEVAAEMQKANLSDTDAKAVASNYAKIQDPYTFGGSTESKAQLAIAAHTMGLDPTGTEDYYYSIAKPLRKMTNPVKAWFGGVSPVEDVVAFSKFMKAEGYTDPQQAVNAYGDYRKRVMYDGMNPTGFVTYSDEGMLNFATEAAKNGMDLKRFTQIAEDAFRQYSEKYKDQFHKGEGLLWKFGDFLGAVIRRKGDIPKTFADLEDFSKGIEKNWINSRIELFDYADASGYDKAAVKELYLWFGDNKARGNHFDHDDIMKAIRYTYDHRKGQGPLNKDEAVAEVQRQNDERRQEQNRQDNDLASQQAIQMMNQSLQMMSQSFHP